MYNISLLQIMTIITYLLTAVYAMHALLKMRELYHNKGRQSLVRDCRISMTQHNIHSGMCGKIRHSLALACLRC